MKNVWVVFLTVISIFWANILLDCYTFALVPAKTDVINWIRFGQLSLYAIGSIIILLLVGYKFGSNK